MAKQATAARRGVDGQINRSVILQAALRLVDRDGVDGLSMRRLSEEVGRDPAVLYRHVPSKAALLDGVTEMVIGQLRIDTADPDWAASYERRRTGFVSWPWITQISCR